MIYKYKNIFPKIGSNCFIAFNSSIIGKVEIAEGSSIWFGAVLRGDFNYIKIGKSVSIQDNCILHVDHEGPVEIGDNVAVGHGAIIHSAKVGNNCIIGMGAILLTNSKIGSNCIIGAGSIVTEGTEIPDNSIALGSPAKVIKQVAEAHIERINRNIRNYNMLNEEYLKKENFENL